MGAGARCDGHAYRAGHLVPSRHWLLITPDGERLSLCSPECVLEAVCEPRPPARLESDRPLRRGLLELVAR